MTSEGRLGIMSEIQSEAEVVTTNVSTTGSPLSNRTYDVLKWIALILLPACGTLYFSLALLWGFPSPDKVMGTISAIGVFLGLILGISSKAYTNADNTDGDMILDTSHPEKDVIRMALNGDPAELMSKKAVTFKVVKN